MQHFVVKKCFYFKTPDGAASISSPSYSDKKRLLSPESRWDRGVGRGGGGGGSWGGCAAGGGMAHRNSVTTFPRIPLFHIALRAKKTQGQTLIYHMLEYIGMWGVRGGGSHMETP